MDHLLRDPTFARPYLDDIIVASNSPEKHMAYLRALFNTLCATNIRVTNVSWRNDR